MRRVLTVVSLKRGFLMLAIVVTAWAQVVSPAQGRGHNCTDRASALAHLSKAYQEQPVAMGLASSGGVVEVLTDDQGSSWSIIVTLPSGVTCLVAAGEDWENIKAVAVAEEES